MRLEPGKAWTVERPGSHRPHWPQHDWIVKGTCGPMQLRLQLALVALVRRIPIRPAAFRALAFLVLKECGRHRLAHTPWQVRHIRHIREGHYRRRSDCSARQPLHRLEPALPTKRRVASHLGGELCPSRGCNRWRVMRQHPTRPFSSRLFEEHPSVREWSCQPSHGCLQRLQALHSHQLGLM